METVAALPRAMRFLGRRLFCDGIIGRDNVVCCMTVDEDDNVVCLWCGCLAVVVLVGFDICTGIAVEDAVVVLGACNVN